MAGAFSSAFSTAFDRLALSAVGYRMVFVPAVDLSRPLRREHPLAQLGSSQ